MCVSIHLRSYQVLFDLNILCILCVYVHMHPCVLVLQGQKSVSDSMEPELLAVVSHLVGAGKNLGPLGEQPVLLCQAISPSYRICIHCPDFLSILEFQ